VTHSIRMMPVVSTLKSLNFSKHSLQLQLLVNTTLPAASDAAAVKFSRNEEDCHQPPQPLYVFIFCFHYSRYPQIGSQHDVFVVDVISCSFPCP